MNNEKLLEQFIKDKEVNGIGKKRIIKYRYLWKNIHKLLDKDIKKLKEQDIKDLVLKINEQKWADWTKYDHKVFFKIFWRWFKKDDNPKEIKDIKTNGKNGNHKLPEELLTQEEIRSLITATSNLKYKLLVSLLYESGARILEVLTLKLKHISFEKDKPIAKILVNGKTGMRRVPLYASLPHLRKYLNEAHMDKDNPNAFLFYANGSASKRIRYNTIRLRLRWIKKKANVKKAVNPLITNSIQP